MSCLPETLCQSDEQIQVFLNKLQEAQTLVMMIMAVWGLTRGRSKYRTTQSECHDLNQKVYNEGLVSHKFCP